MDTDRLKSFVETFWEDSILPSITEYIRIPNKSPAFDPDWAEHGYMDEAVTLIEALGAAAARGASPAPRWRSCACPAARRSSSSTCRATGDDTVLLYGHLDKQPEMTGWAEGMGPWMPVLKGDKLYGRGGADDGYAMFACARARCWRCASRACRTRAA